MPRALPAMKAKNKGNQPPVKTPVKAPAAVVKSNNNRGRRGSSNSESDDDSYESKSRSSSRNIALKSAAGATFDVKKQPPNHHV